MVAGLFRREHVAQAARGEQRDPGDHQQHHDDRHTGRNRFHLTSVTPPDKLAR